jgi:hypothetical protein
MSCRDKAISDFPAGPMATAMGLRNPNSTITQVVTSAKAAFIRRLVALLNPERF